MHPFMNELCRFDVKLSDSEGDRFKVARHLIWLIGHLQDGGQQHENSDACLGGAGTYICIRIYLFIWWHTSKMALAAGRFMIFWPLDSSLSCLPNGLASLLLGLLAGF